MKSQLKQNIFAILTIQIMLLLVACDDASDKDEVANASLLAQNDLLQRKYAALEGRYEQRASQFAQTDKLQIQHDDLQSQYSALAQRYEQQQAKIASLEQQVRNLSGDSGAGQPAQQTTAVDSVTREATTESDLNTDVIEDVAVATDPIAGVAAASAGKTDERLPLRHKGQFQLDEASSFVKSWRAAWVSLDADRFLSHYSKQFTTESGLSYDQWVANRQAMFANSNDIEIDVSNLRSHQAEDNPLHIVVIFEQAYRSATYRDRVQKTLTLQKSDGSWQINKETASP